MSRPNHVLRVCRRWISLCAACIALAACGSSGPDAGMAASQPGATGPANAADNTVPAPTAANPVSPSVANMPPSGTGNQPLTNTTVASGTATSDSNPDAPAPPQGAPAAGITLMAGTIGGPGSLDGTGAAARFFGPSGAVRDSAGNLIVADTDNHAIRKVAPDGAVTTLAGAAGVEGAADGNALSARFSFPRGMAFDAAGNLYVADTGNHAIRKISAAGVVSTLAGAPGTSGNADGTGAAARFNAPTDIAPGSAGNFYVTDTDNGLIRTLTPSGAVGTLRRGDGTSAVVQLHGPRGIAIDAAGNLYVTVSEAYHEPLGRQFIGSAVLKITAAGATSTLAGDLNATGSADGAGSAARFDRPGGIALDAGGNAYVADTQNHAVRKITPAGVVSTLAGMPSSGAQSGCGSADGNGSVARFCNPSSIVADAAGNLLVTDAANGAIRTIRQVGAAAQVATLAGLAAVYGSVDGTGAAARFNTPNGLHADAAGNAYVADLFNGTIRKITAAGAVTTLAGAAGMLDHADGSASAAHFAYPFDLVADAAGNFYVTEELGRTVRRISAAGAVDTLAGLPGESGSADGQGAEAQFNSPFGIAIDAAGLLYVADEGNCNIRTITAAGAAATFAGSSCGSADGSAAAARFSFPFGIAVDASGNVYVADTYNNTIRKITPAGTASTLAGQAGSKGSADGQGTAARFNSPAGLAVDSAGNVYVADTLNNTIRRITPAGAVSTVAGDASRRGIVLGALPGGLSWPRDVALVNDKTLLVTSANGVLRVALP